MRSLLLAIFMMAAIRGTIEIGERGEMVKVGALFFRGEEEIEMSFDEAFNEMNNLKFFEVDFETIKRYVPTDDSFVLQELTCELISNGVAAIFGPSSKASSDIVALIAKTVGIPHIEFDWRLESPIQEMMNYNLTINVTPKLSSISKAYLDIVQEDFLWRTFTIFYEDDVGFARLQDLMKVKVVDNDNIKVRRISDYSSDYRVLWKEAAEVLHEQRLIVDCSPDLLEKLLEYAMDFNLLGAFRNWFLTHPNTHNSRLSDMYNEAYKANITSVRIKNNYPNPFARKKTRIRRIDEILGNQTVLPIFMYDAVILFANSARNVMTSMGQFLEPPLRCDVSEPWYEGMKIVQEMKTISQDDVEPPFKTEHMHFNEFGQRIEFGLEIYKPTVNEPMAIWKPKGEIVPAASEMTFLPSSTAKDFSQDKRVFTVVTHVEEPYFMLRADHEEFRGWEKYEGYAVDLIRKLSELLEFEYTFIIVGSNGKYDPETKQWDGIMRKLIDHEAQIGICDITITQLRRQFVDFTVPFMQLGISILYYNSPPEPKDPFAFLQPFTKSVWLLTLLVQLVMTLLFVFMSRISYVEWESPNPAIPNPEELENKWNTSNSAWLMVGSIMAQGCDILPRGPPMRILTGSWWFFALMMISIYTANLAAFLTSNKMQSSIKGLSDLIEQTDVAYGTLKGGSTSLFFSESNHTEYQRAWSQMKAFKPSAFTHSNKEGVKRVLKGKGSYAFLMETTSLSYNTERECNLKQIGSPIGEKHYGLAVPLGADYRSNLSVSLLQLSEKGELYKLRTKWWKNHNVTCEKFHEVDGDELSIIELGGVFVVLAGGVAISVIIGIVEFLWNIQTVAVEEFVTPWQALKAELCFALQIWKMHKPMRIAHSSSSRKSSGSASKHTYARSKATPAKND